MRANKPCSTVTSPRRSSIPFSKSTRNSASGFASPSTRALERLLIAKGHNVEREVAVMVYFRGEPLADERMDMLVDGAVVIENKAREPLDPDAQGQLFCWPRGDESRGRPRPSFWQKSALLSRLLRKSVQATKPAVPVVAVAVPCQSTVQLPFPENGASVTGISLPTLDRRVPQVSDREMCFGMRCGV